ncbi:MAG: sigma-70 family RNA polymerase sigma factor [Bacteroidales bacterium]|jgi:RNA polymerase sigma-70 factor (ECF subfamily)|nr:sigma-70 family RNA polymerase sigma factor [Bacteroidales bacterium]MDD4384504.1 sigma-70 family RNA polymerase sigma factor [Bacteroidales bacterium]MDY0196908.1 sigma-70 family RNA polymerase sigma factor [Tenuifilaceae bacterium]
MLTDSELIDNILNNNSQKAFEELVNRYQSLVTKTCLGFVSNYADAEDIAQDVFIEVFHSLKNFRSESKLSTWLYRIAVNKSLNFIRLKKRHSGLRSIESFFTTGNSNKSESIEIASPKSTDADWGIEQQEDKQMLKKAINSLPENQRIAFILSKYHDLSYKEIAEIMSITLSSVESLLFRAKQNLQKKLLKEINN